MLRLALLDDAALVHKEDAVGHLARETHLVRDDQHGHAAQRQFLHDVQHFLDHFGVQRRGGLVEEHDLGFHGEGAGDGDALLLPAGELAGVLVGLLRDADALQQLHGVALDLGARAVPHADGGQRDVLHRRQVREEVELLEDHADLAANGGDVAHVVAHLHAVNDDLPLLMLLQAVDAADEGGLAGAGRADDDDHFLRGHADVDVAQHVKLAEPLVHVAADDDGFVIHLADGGPLDQGVIPGSGHDIPPLPAQARAAPEPLASMRRLTTDMTELKMK